jgi:membrane protein
MVRPNERYASVTAVSFKVGKSAIGFYRKNKAGFHERRRRINRGADLIYYSSQIILVGAEVTHAFAKHRGSIKKRDSRGPNPASS